ncbi:hypothetical protein vBCbaSRXM_1 [Citromicrobium phage vB_CbaS-RXM]|nr:hypothetical protein vBCbaSRXM_1 [Citromicrobium phage vB_CbaS-RXM]
MKRFECYSKSVYLGTVKAVSLRQACETAKRQYGDCEVMPLDRVARPDRLQTYGRTMRQQARNQTAEGKARIEAIRQAAIAEYQASL